MIKTTIIAVLLMLTLWVSAKAESIYLPLIVGGPEQLVHAYNTGFGFAMQAGEALEIHCEYGTLTAWTKGGVAYVECR